MHDVHSLDFPGIGTAGDSGSLRVEAFSAIRRSGRLTTIQFSERRPDLGEIQELQRTDWGVEVPEGALMWAASAGLNSGAIKQYWAGWVAGDQFAAVALMQEHPTIYRLAEGEKLIGRPVLLADGTLHLFSWRPRAKGGQTLWRHVFRGELHKPGTVESKALTEIERTVVGSIAAPVAAPTMPGAPAVPGGGKRIVLGWIEPAGDGLQMSVAVVEGDDIQIWPGLAVAQTAPLSRQRPAVWAGREGTFEMAALGERLTPERALVVLRMRVDPRATVAPQAQAQAFPVTNGKVLAGACEYRKQVLDAPLHWVALISDGELWRNSSSEPRKQKTAVGPDYDFPIFTTNNSLYRTDKSSSGEVTVRGIDEQGP